MPRKKRQFSPEESERLARMQMEHRLPFHFSKFKLCNCRCICPMAENVISIIDAPEDDRIVETVRTKLWKHGMDYLVRPGAARGYLTALDPKTLPLNWDELAIDAFQEGELAYYRRKNS